MAIVEIIGGKERTTTEIVQFSSIPTEEIASGAGFVDVSIAQEADYSGANTSTIAQEKDSMGMYLDEIGAYPLLSKEDEVELSKAIHEGILIKEDLELSDLRPSRAQRRDIEHAADAKEKFINSNLRLVVSIAKRYPVPYSMKLLDLVQQGNLGLEHSVDKFDWQKGFRFSTYGALWIRQAICRFLDEESRTVRLPANVGASLRKALEAAGGDYNQLDEEHAKIYAVVNTTSLDQQVTDDGTKELVDLVPDSDNGPETVVIQKQEVETVLGLLSMLDEHSLYAVEQRFGLNDGRKRSYNEVGKDIGMTAESARRLVKLAISTLRESPEAEEFDIG